MKNNMFLRVASWNEITPPGLDGHRYRVTFEVGAKHGDNFTAEKAHTMTITTSGTLQSMWGQTDSQVATSSLTAATLWGLHAASEGDIGRAY
jgi:hypothetical protein